MLTKGVISWYSKIQGMTSSGTSQAEYIALSEAVKEVLILRRVQDMEPSMRIGAINVLEENKRAIKLLVNKYASRRTKHIGVNHHLMSDAGKDRAVYVRPKEQWCANLFSKSLDIQKFH